MQRLCTVLRFTPMIAICAFGTATGCADSDDIDDSAVDATLACVEDDAAEVPFSGPGWDPAAGLSGAPQDSYVASATWIQVNPERADRFGELAGAIISGMGRQPGLIGLALRQSAKCGIARTLTVWESVAAMYDFVSSEAHLAAMAESSEVGLSGGVVHWDVTPENVPPSWDEAIREVEGEAARGF